MRIFIKTDGGSVCSSAITLLKVEDDITARKRLLVAELTSGTDFIIGKYDSDDVFVAHDMLLHFIQGNYDSYCNLCQEAGITPVGRQSNIFPAPEL